MEESMRSPLIRQVCSALWQRRKRFAFIAVVSFVIVFLLGLIVMLLSPKEKLYSQDIRLFLGKNKAGMLVYPNDKAFNRFDIISAPVLKEVYQRNKLEKLIGYEDFATSFLVVNYSPDLAFINAEFAQKLSRRNLNTVDLKALEEEYNDRLASLDQANFRISMERSGNLPSSLAARIVTEIPQVWADIFRRQEAKGFPQNVLTSDLKDKLESEFQGSPLIAIDRAFYYNIQMERLCRALEMLQQDRRISLPSGEFLEDVSERLTYIRNYQLNVLLQMLLDDHALLGPMDQVFVASRIRSYEQTLLEKRGMLTNVQESIAQLRTPVNGSGSPVRESGKNDAASALQLNVDAGFFSQLSELIRNDVVGANLVEQVETFSRLGNEVAATEAQLAHYTQLLSGIQGGNGGRKVDAQLFAKLFRNMLTEMIQTGLKLDEFKALITQDALSNREFYVPVGPVLVQTEYGVSKKALFIGLFAVWLLIVFCPMAAVAGKVIWQESIAADGDDTEERSA